VRFDGQLKGVLTTALCLFVGCGEEVEQMAPPTGSSSPTPDAITGEPLGPAEGPTVVFGLNLPVRSHVLESTPLGATVQIPWGFEKTANYFRARVEAESVNVGARATVFANAKIVGSGTDERFHIAIRRTAQTTRVVFRKEVAGPKPGAGQNMPEEAEPEPDPSEATGRSAGPPPPSQPPKPQK